MNSINITNQEFSKLKELELLDIIYNNEGQVYDFNYNGENKILKFLYNRRGNLFANKLYTLEMLDFYREYLPSNFVLPDNLVSVDEKVVGFTIPKFNGINFADLLNRKDISNKDKLYYFKRIGEILNELKNIRNTSPLNNIYINDLHESNILINLDTKELGIIDLDSCRLSKNGCFPSKYLGPSFFIGDTLEKYILNEDGNGIGYVYANENSDLYCYNVMILNFLYGNRINRMSSDNYKNYLKYLKDIKLDEKLIDSFYKLSVKEKNKNPMNYLDSITDEQLFNAKKHVYEKHYK